MLQVRQGQPVGGIWGKVVGHAFGPKSRFGGGGKLAKASVDQPVALCGLSSLHIGILDSNVSLHVEGLGLLFGAVYLAARTPMQWPDAGGGVEKCSGNAVNVQNSSNGKELNVRRAAVG